MIRWKYVAPRLILLGLLGFGVWFGADWTARFAMIQTGQSLLGSRVEIDRVDVQFARSQVIVDRLVMADPDSPFRNLMEAERASFDVETYAALRKKLVVREGVVEGIRFHTPRETDGILPKDEADAESGKSSVWGHVQSIGKRGEDWVDESFEKFESELENELQTVKLSKELKQRWPESYRRIADQGKRLEQQARRIRDQAKLIADDPVQHLAQIQPTLANIEQLRRDTIGFRDQFAQLQGQFSADRRAIEQAKEHDVRYVRERLKLTKLDGDSLTDYLLGPVWSERVQIALNWIQRSRSIAESDQPQEADNDLELGYTVQFPGFPSSADVLIRQLRLSGNGTADGSEFKFQGIARDLTHQPSRHAKPATLEVVADGSIQMKGQAVLDRRRTIPVDRFMVTLPSIAQHGQVLGKPEKLAVEIAPGRARVVADITVRDSLLEGTIRLNQDQLQLTPHLPDRYSKYVSQESLSSATSGIRELQAEVTLSGELRKPKYQLASNLGPQLAQGLNQAIQQELIARQEQLLQLANREVDSQLNKLQHQLTKQHGQLLNQLELGDEQLNQLKQLLASKAGGSAGRLLKSIFK